MAFQTTAWSVVEDAQAGGEDGDRALALLCEAYWQPLFQHARQRGMAEDAAKDAVQGFFLRVIEKRYLDAADAAKGRFRTYLLTCFQRFLANEYQRATAKKRDGNLQRVSIDWELPEGAARSMPTSDVSAETLFDREWADALIARAGTQLRAQESNSGRGAQYDALAPILF
jgi:DNA-directed RNA polymerase specialized sigma24 family protein